MKVTKRNLSFEVVDSDWSGFWMNDLWEVRTYEILSKYLTKDHNYLDIGAWIGPTVLYGAQLCKTCYAVEPDPVAIKELKENIQLNTFDNVSVYECALSNFTGKTKMGAANLGDSMFRFVSNDNVIEVDCFTISDFVERNNIEDISFIKMDIEGGEEQVLQDLEFFSKKIPLYLSIHHIYYPDSDRACEVMSKVCKMYDRMYDDNFNRVDVSHIYNKDYDGFLTIILE